MNFNAYMVVNKLTHKIEYMCLDIEDLRNIKSKYVDSEWFNIFDIIRIPFDYDSDY